MKDCFYFENTGKEYNPCGECKKIKAKYFCFKDKEKLKSWGCLYRCEHEHLKPEEKQIKMDF